MSNKNLMSHDPLADLGLAEPNEVSATEMPKTVTSEEVPIEVVSMAEAPVMVEPVGSSSTEEIVIEEPIANKAMSDGAPESKIKLESSLNISDVAEHHALFLARIAPNGEVVIDGSDIERIDGAGLQLLAAFVKQSHKESCVISWCEASEALLEAAAQVGLLSALHLDEVQQAA